MKPIKFRLRVGNKVVGYEKWYGGHLVVDDPCFADPRWLYSVDGEKWSPKYIFHRDKDLFTGLLDKNGKEIWEGDIVKEGEFIGKVFFKNGSFCVSYINTPKEFGDEYYPVFNKMNTHEVIGNIYESPKLMEAKE